MIGRERPEAGIQPIKKGRLMHVLIHHGVTEWATLLSHLLVAQGERHDCRNHAIGKRD